MPPRWVNGQWDVAWVATASSRDRRLCGSLERAGGSGQMRQRGCREDSGCLGAPQAARGTPRAAHTPRN